MPLLAGTLYDPGTAVTHATTGALAMTAMDTTNLRLTFTAPPSGIVQVRISCCVHGSNTYPTILLGVLEDTTVRGRIAPIGGLKTTAVNTAMVTQEAVFLVSGLSGSVTLDAAYGVETGISSTAIKYGGPNDTTTNNAFGGIAFEVWSVD
jgi:hypothetical protein